MKTTKYDFLSSDKTFYKIRDKFDTARAADIFEQIIREYAAYTYHVRSYLSEKKGFIHDCLRHALNTLIKLDGNKADIYNIHGVHSINNEDYQLAISLMAVFYNAGVINNVIVECNKGHIWNIDEESLETFINKHSSCGGFKTYKKEHITLYETYGSGLKYFFKFAKPAFPLIERFMIDIVDNMSIQPYLLNRSQLYQYIDGIEDTYALKEQHKDPVDNVIVNTPIPAQLGYVPVEHFLIERVREMYYYNKAPSNTPLEKTENVLYIIGEQYTAINFDQSENSIFKKEIHKYWRTRFPILAIDRLPEERSKNYFSNSILQALDKRRALQRHDKGSSPFKFHVRFTDKTGSNVTFQKAIFIKNEVLWKGIDVPKFKGTITILGPEEVTVHGFANSKGIIKNKMVQGFIETIQLDNVMKHPLRNLPEYDEMYANMHCMILQPFSIGESDYDKAVRTKHTSKTVPHSIIKYFADKLREQLQKHKKQRFNVITLLSQTAYSKNYRKYYAVNSRIIDEWDKSIMRELKSNSIKVHNFTIHATTNIIPGHILSDFQEIKQIAIFMNLKTMFNIWKEHQVEITNSFDKADSMLMVNPIRENAQLTVIDGKLVPLPANSPRSIPVKKVAPYKQIEGQFTGEIELESSKKQVIFRLFDLIFPVSGRYHFDDSHGFYALFHKIPKTYPQVVIDMETADSPDKLKRTFGKVAHKEIIAVDNRTKKTQRISFIALQEFKHILMDLKIIIHPEPLSLSYMPAENDYPNEDYNSLLKNQKYYIINSNTASTYKMDFIAGFTEKTSFMVVRTPGAD